MLYRFLTHIRLIAKVRKEPQKHHNRRLPKDEASLRHLGVLIKEISEEFLPMSPLVGMNN